METNKQTRENSKEWAEEQFKIWLDEIDLEEEDIYEPSLSKDELDEFEYMTEEDIRKEVIEARRDVKLIVKSFMNGRLRLSDDKELIYKLRTPISNSKDSITELTFKNDYQVKDHAANTRNLKANDAIGQFNALIATIVGINRIKIGLVFGRDMKLIQSVVGLLLLVD